MDFIERLQGLSKKITQIGATLETEEATKNALIMPFLHSVLGYDVFDPTEVVPEFTADTGTKKGEKVDYALLKDGEVQILIECKKFRDKLSTKHASQLFRYFSLKFRSSFHPVDSISNVNVSNCKLCTKNAAIFSSIAAMTR
ncbi:MAG: type I restriction enzyme HsdR N-terminal domain-containing protein, partial [Reinekea sp.]